MECYHTFSISRGVYLAKNHYDNYSPQMVPVTPNLGVWLMDYINQLMNKANAKRCLACALRSASGMNLVIVSLY